MITRIKAKFDHQLAKPRLAAQIFGSVGSCGIWVSGLCHLSDFAVISDMDTVNDINTQFIFLLNINKNFLASYLL
ncbi:MAG: hypothetical protein LBT62_01235, partial [Deltaproteobacteria bacterium]|nr:hypothetical protein [Deltaproteobacteria bacterium]